MSIVNSTVYGPFGQIREVHSSYNPSIPPKGFASYLENQINKVLVDATEIFTIQIFCKISEEGRLIDPGISVKKDQEFNNNVAAILVNSPLRTPASGNLKKPIIDRHLIDPEISAKRDQEFNNKLVTILVNSPLWIPATGNLKRPIIDDQIFNIEVWRGKVKLKIVDYDQAKSNFFNITN